MCFTLSLGRELWSDLEVELAFVGIAERLQRLNVLANDGGHGRLICNHGNMERAGHVTAALHKGFQDRALIAGATETCFCRDGHDACADGSEGVLELAADWYRRPRQPCLSPPMGWQERQCASLREGGAS